MRKLFTLLFVAVTAIAARATDYNVPITVTVNGELSEQMGVITIVENNGLYDLTLKNFVLQNESMSLGVGNVELKGMKPYQDGDATLLLTKETITITDGDDPNVDIWMAAPCTRGLACQVRRRAATLLHRHQSGVYGSGHPSGHRQRLSDT